MVSREIPRQAWLFGMAFASGAGMLLVYDVFRIVRRIVRHNTAGIAVEDMFFWLGCAFWLFRLMYRENDGIIRGFVIFGAFAGMVCYNLLLSRYFVRGGTAVLGVCVKAAVKIVRVLTAPFRIFGRRIRRGAGFCRKLCKKQGRRTKKRLKKIWKAVKMGLCKL